MDDEDSLLMIKPKTWAADKMPFAFKDRQKHSGSFFYYSPWGVYERKRLENGPFFKDEKSFGGFYLITIHKNVQSITVKYFAALQKDCFRHLEFEDEETPIFPSHLDGYSIWQRCDNVNWNAKMFKELNDRFNNDFSDVGLKVNFLNLPSSIDKLILFFETTLWIQGDSDPIEEFKVWFPKIKKAMGSAKFKGYIRECLTWIIDDKSYISDHAHRFCR